MADAIRTWTKCRTPVRVTVVNGAPFIDDFGGDSIAKCYDAQQANTIAAVLNAHAGLVEGLKQCLYLAESTSSNNDARLQVIANVARSALADTKEAR